MLLELPLGEELIVDPEPPLRVDEFPDRVELTLFCLLLVDGSARELSEFEGIVRLEGELELPKLEPRPEELETVSPGAEEEFLPEIEEGRVDDEGMFRELSTELRPEEVLEILE